jgi:hypothetical protein
MTTRQESRKALACLPACTSRFPVAITMVRGASRGSIPQYSGSATGFSGAEPRPGRGIFCPLAHPTLDEPVKPHPNSERPARSVCSHLISRSTSVTSHKKDPYTELKKQINEDLRAQHPEWIEPTGDCPTCDSYLSRLSQLLERVADAMVRRKTRG